MIRCQSMVGSFIKIKLILRMLYQFKNIRNFDMYEQAQSQKDIPYEIPLPFDKSCTYLIAYPPEQTSDVSSWPQPYPTVTYSDFSNDYESLKEHQMSFRSSILSLLKNAYPMEEFAFSTQENNPFNGSSQKNIRQISVEDCILDCESINYGRRMKLLQRIKKEAGLYRFLDFIYQEFIQIRHDITFIVEHILEAYESIKQKEKYPDYITLIKLASEQAQLNAAFFYYHKSLQTITLRADRFATPLLPHDRLFFGFTAFLTNLYRTGMLIMDGYFVNPGCKNSLAHGILYQNSKKEVDQSNPPQEYENSSEYIEEQAEQLL